MHVYVLVVGKTFVRQDHTWEKDKENTAFQLGTQTSSGLPWHLHLQQGAPADITTPPPPPPPPSNLQSISLFGLGLRHRRLFKSERKDPITLVWREEKRAPIFQGGDGNFKLSHPISQDCVNPSNSLLAGAEEGHSPWWSSPLCWWEGNLVSFHPLQAWVFT